MNKKINRIISVLLVISMLLSFAACGASDSKPEAVVKTFCESLKKFDLESMAKCFEITEDFDWDSLIGSEEEMGSELYDMLKTYAKSVDYSVGSANIDGDTAAVNVDFKYYDISPAIAEATGNYVSQLFSMAFSGKSYSEAELAKMVADEFAAALKTNPPEKQSVSAELKCKKVDSAWKLTFVGEEVLNVLTSNMAATLEEMGGSLSGF